MSQRLIRVAIALMALASVETSAQTPSPAKPPNDLDALMAKALQRRDVDRRTLSDYVLDELETFEVLGPGGAPLTRLRREYTWYVRDGIHVRSPGSTTACPSGNRSGATTKTSGSRRSRIAVRTARSAKRNARPKGKRRRSARRP